MEYKRVPVKRVPIKFTKDLKNQILFRELLQNRKNKEIIKISQSYDLLVCRFNHLTGHYSLSRQNPQKHKNWKHFERVYMICLSNNWDYKLFMECQFTRAKNYWNNGKIKYPLPNMLYSDSAKKSFEIFMEDRQEKYENDLSKTNLFKSKSIKNTKQRVINDLITSVEYLVRYFNFSDNVEKQSETKAIRIYHDWECFSPAYLWTVPWFKEFIKELETVNPDCEKIQTILKEWNMIKGSKTLQQIIDKTVKILESKFNIPKNIAI